MSSAVKRRSFSNIYGDKFAKPFDRAPSSKRDDRRSQYRERSSHEDDFMEHRRKERERITLIGVEQVWGKSPLHAEE